MKTCYCRCFSRKCSLIESERENMCQSRIAIVDVPKVSLSSFAKMEEDEEKLVPSATPFSNRHLNYFFPFVFPRFFPTSTSRVCLFAFNYNTQRLDTAYFISNFVANINNKTACLPAAFYLAYRGTQMPRSPQRGVLFADDFQLNL